MSNQKQTVMTEILPPKPRKPRVVTDPTKAQWVARATNAEMELKRVTIERDKATENAENLRASLAYETRHKITTAHIVVLVALFAAAAFAVGVVCGKVVL